MKFVTVILPLLAVFVQSSPVERDGILFYPDSPCFKAAVKDRAQIQSQLIDLQKAFEDANIDPKAYYCPGQGYPGLIKQVRDAPGLSRKTSKLARLFVKYNKCGAELIYHNYLFCSPLMDMLNALE